MLTGLMLGEMPPKYPAPEGSSLPPTSTKKPLENEEKRRSRKDMKVEKTVDRKEERLAELQQERSSLEKRLRELMFQVGTPLMKQILNVIEKLDDVEESIEIVKEYEEDA